MVLGYSQALKGKFKISLMHISPLACSQGHLQSKKMWKHLGKRSKVCNYCSDCHGSDSTSEAVLRERCSIIFTHLTCYTLPVVEMAHSSSLIIGSTFNSAQGDFHIHNTSRDSESGMHNFRWLQKSIRKTIHYLILLSSSYFILLTCIY